MAKFNYILSSPAGLLDPTKFRNKMAVAHNPINLDDLGIRTMPSRRAIDGLQTGSMIKLRSKWCEPLDVREGMDTVHSICAREFEYDSDVTYGKTCKSSIASSSRVCKK